MSYLHSPRMVFSGDFLSDVSTVNNDTAHYNNTTFHPSFQEPAAPGKPGSNGWWNPEGGAVFSLQHCTVRQVTLTDGTVETDPAADSILGLRVTGSEGRPSGKMVDLDPDMQMVSALWCVQIRICTPANELLLQGDMTTTSFRDLQFRQTDGGRTNGQPLGGTWTSVLTNLVWGEKAAASPFLSQLRAVTQGNQLSVNLNAFGYHYNHSPDGRYSLGRLIGSIGPWFYGEPDTFAPARRLYGMLNTNGPTFFTISNFLSDIQNKRLTVDFGSSFPIADPMGTINFNQPLFLALSLKPVDVVPGTVLTLKPEDFIQIGPLTYNSDPDWLHQTGGIISFNLSEEITAQLAQKQLLLLTPSSTAAGQYAVIAREAVNGFLVRADNFVQRLDTGDTSIVHIYAYQWGNPLVNHAITLTLDPPTPNTPVGPQNPISEKYGNNFPEEGLTFPGVVQTDQYGHARLPLTGNAIHSPRVYLDGQIYTISYRLQTFANDYGNFAAFPDVIVVHVRDAFEIQGHPTWADIAPTMIQYSNLYPIMSKYVVNMADPAGLIARRDILTFAFTRDINDTMHMPVTRDLSKAKRQAILSWLQHPDTADTRKLKAFAADNAAAGKPHDTNPLPEQTSFTTAQQKYRKVVQAKSGATRAFPVVENLFKNI
jgi:hypothetical protein